MVEFQFMSGLNTIGGNIVDIRTDLGRVIFDYGEISTPETGELPHLSDSFENTAIFISHLHIDHVGSFPFIPKEIPIYMSEESYQLYLLLVEIGEEPAIQAPVYPMVYDEAVHIGDITVVFKKSDHDVRGAAALFVQTPDVKLVYSGDVRLTGNYPERVEQWVKEAQAFKPDIFLLEGTTFSFDEDRVDLAEEALYVKWAEVLEQAKDEIIFLNTYIRDTDRLLQLAKIAKEKNRMVVLEPKYAYLLKELENYTDTYVLQELDTTERYKDRWITIERLQENPGQYLLQNSFGNRQLLERFNSGVYGHSNGEPLGDYDVRYAELISSIEENQFRWQDLNAGGHATKEDLIRIAQMLDAKTTIPWHSFYPKAMQQALAETGLSTFLPSLDVVYSIQRVKEDEHGINDLSNE